MAWFLRRSSLLGGDPLVGRRRLFLGPPSTGLFLASAVLALVAVLMRYTAIDIAVINARYLFELLLIAYAILAVGVLAGRGRL